MGGRLSIQRRLFPDATCFGCGPANTRGLRLESFAEDDGSATARFVPWPEHDNGLGYLNGGIIATLLDCHGGAAAFLHADRSGWRVAPGVPFPFVTAGLDVRYRRPTPLAEACELRAEVVAGDEDQVEVRAQLSVDGSLRATGMSTWRRWRPRP